MSFHGNLDCIYKDLLGRIQAVCCDLIATSYVNILWISEEVSAGFMDLC